MKPMMCFDSVSAGLFLDGEVAVLSFLTNDSVNETHASVLLTREMLQTLNRSIHRALVRNGHEPQHGGDSEGGAGFLAHRGALISEDDLRPRRAPAMPKRL